MNSKYYTWRLSNWRYPEIIQVMDDHDHDLVLKQPWSLGNSPWKFPSFRKPPYHINESFKAATHGQVPTHPIRARKNRSAKKPIQPKWPQICSACVLYMYVYYIYTHNLHFHHQQLPFTFMYHTFPRTYKKRQSPLPVINGYNVITCNKWI